MGLRFGCGMLRAQPHITSVHLDWAHNVVHVGYHPEMISPDTIEQVIADETVKTPDLGGKATTAEMTKAITAAFETRLPA